MRLKLDEFEGMTVLNIRGTIEPTQGKVLFMGLSSLLKKESPVIIFNFSRAKMGAAEAQLLLNLKKIQSKVNTLAKIYWIGKDRTIADVPSLENFFSRMSGSRHRQAAELLRLQDQMDEYLEEKAEIEIKLKSLAGDETTHHAIVAENLNLKTQKKVLEAMVKWQRDRIHKQTAEPPTMEDCHSVIKAGRITLNETLLKMALIANKDEDIGL